VIAAFKLPNTLQQIIPSLSGWIDSLATNPTAVGLQNVFAQIEVFHILGLFALGSCVILTSLRLMGVGLVEAPASTIYRNTRIWLHVGVAVAIISGLLMGLSNASKLYNNTAFLWKMIAMIAAIIFSYAVLVPTAKADGQVSGGVKVGLVVGLVIWALSFLIMLTNKGANVGVFHVMFAATLIGSIALQGRSRWVLLIGVALAIVVLQILTHAVPDFKDPFSDIYMTINKVFMWGTGLFLLALMAWNVMGKSAAEDSTALSRFIGICAILAWVSVGAGGRWIGLT
jgi:hypothetical protein